MKVLNGGVEWTPSGGVQPTVGVSFAGFDAQLQKNQAMIGFVNPAGVGGARIGAEFSEPGVRVLATSQAYLVSRGGALRLGQDSFGRGASLEWSMWIPGGYTSNGAWVSGEQRAAILGQLGASAGGAMMERSWRGSWRIMARYCLDYW